MNNNGIVQYHNGQPVNASSIKSASDIVLDDGRTLQDFLNNLAIGGGGSGSGSGVPQSHVGMIIHSTTLDTEAKVKALYGGTTWTKLEGKFLLGASSSHAVGTTGGAETVTLTSSEIPSHSHTFTGTSANHNHGASGLSIPSGGGHAHDIKSSDGKVFYYKDGIVQPNTASGWHGGLSSYNWGATYKLITQSNGGAHSHTISGNVANASVTPKGTISNTGGSGSHNNMPPYKTVYIWERTA